MILHTTTYTVPRAFDTIEDFQVAVFGDHEIVFADSFEKLAELIAENKLLFSSPILKEGGKTLEVTRLWIDQTAKEEYDDFRTNHPGFLALEADLESRGVIQREKTEVV